MDNLHGDKPPGTQRARVTINNHLCLTQYIRAKFCEGVPRDAAIREFDLFVRTKPELCIYENDQWHVPDYGGIQTLASNVDASGWALSRGTQELGNEAAVRSRVQAGQALVSSVAKCDAELASSSIGPALLDAPRIAVNPADAMQPMPPAYAMQDAIACEAVSGLLHWDRASIKYDTPQGPQSLNHHCLRLGAVGASTQRPHQALLVHRQAARL